MPFDSWVLNIIVNLKIHLSHCVIVTTEEYSIWIFHFTLFTSLNVFVLMITSSISNKVTFIFLIRIKAISESILFAHMSCRASNFDFIMKVERIRDWLWHNWITEEWHHLPITHYWIHFEMVTSYSAALSYYLVLQIL